MARDRLTFRQRDLTAAIKAVEAAGRSIARIEIRQDGIVIIPVDPDPEPEAVSETEQLDRQAEHALQRIRAKK